LGLCKIDFVGTEEEAVENLNILLQVAPYYSLEIRRCFVRRRFIFGKFHRGHITMFGKNPDFTRFTKDMKRLLTLNQKDDFK